jgi:PQQ-dependent catabolism-associated beta-propeller protein
MECAVHKRRKTLFSSMRQGAGLSFAVFLVASCSSPPGPDRVFVSDEAQDVVHVFDGVSGRSEGTLATGKRPRGLALSPNQRVLFVAASNSQRIELWDVRTLAHLRDIASGSDPERIALSPDGRTVYAANEDRSTVSFIDVGSGRVIREVAVGPEPEGIGVSPDGRLVVVTSEVANTAHLIDTRSGALLDNLLVGSRPRDVRFLKGGRELWVSSEQRGTISVFELPSRRMLRTIDLVAAFPNLTTVQAVEMEVTPDERRVLVAMGRGDGVAEIEPVSGNVVRRFPTGHRTWGIGFSPDRARLYAASGLTGSATIIDLETNKVTHTVKLGGKPWTAEAAPR